MIDTVFLGPRKVGGSEFLLPVGSFSNKREYSEADWLVPLVSIVLGTCRPSKLGIYFRGCSQIMMLSQKFQKSDFLVPCSFTHFFHDVEMLMRKPKTFVKVIQRFWYVLHVGLMFLKIHQKQPKLQLW
jgi:hypothetical protein